MAKAMAPVPVKGAGAYTYILECNVAEHFTVCIYKLYQWIF